LDCSLLSIQTMEITYFANQTEFREWLDKNHKKETEIIVGFYKVGTGKPSLTWPQSVDQALCFGWIDGIRRSIDQDSYSIRFTPRRPGSNWSAVNIKKANELIEKGLMEPAGMKLFSLRKQEKSEVYSYENMPERLPDSMEISFRENEKAWSFFSCQAPSYQKTRIYWIMSAKQEATQISRLIKLIAACEQQKRLF
jgi:uncharacterized protein YdeI (YjbR/CyaY-like superfamily)